MAAKLLDAFSDRPTDSGLEEPVTLGFNPSSGNVYLCDQDGNCAMMNGKKLELWYSCPECGHEGFKEDMPHGDDNPECQQYLRDIEAIPDEAPDQ